MSALGQKQTYAAQQGMSALPPKADTLKAKVAQGGVIVRAAPQLPVIFALALFDWQIVNASDPSPHQALRVKLPILVSVTAEPMTGIVVPFIGKAHSDPIVAESPHLLNEPIIELAIPFAGEECLDFLAPMNEFGAVSPNAVGGIGECYASGVAGIPGVLGEARLLRGGFCAEGRQWWTAHELTPFLFERSRVAP